MQIFGINMAVSVNGEVGSPMIREGQEIDLFVRRTLRDVFRKVPTFSAEMKVLFFSFLAKVCLLYGCFRFN